MAAFARDSSRFAGVKTFSEKFSQPEVDAEGRVRKVGINTSDFFNETADKFPYHKSFREVHCF